MCALPLAMLLLLEGIANAKTALVAVDRWTLADFADVFLDRPIVLKGRVVSARPAGGSVSPSGHRRVSVEAEVVTLLLGPGDIPRRVRYLADIAPDGRGRMPRLKNAEVLVAALPVAGRPGVLQLATRDAQLGWDAAREAQVRALIETALAPGAPPPVTGIASAFHVPGTLPGEGETQVFLTTADARPVSLTILRRPGEPPRWAMAAGEIVDEAATAPAPGTLGWYRLACHLPPVLPAAATAALTPAEAETARGDYAFVIAELGACARARPRPS